MTDIFYGCSNLTAESYANIANMLPNANQLSNQYLTDMRLSVGRFTQEQQNILNIKGYL